jgi:hypothetical protein
MKMICVLSGRIERFTFNEGDIWIECFIGYISLKKKRFEC